MNPTKHSLPPPQASKDETILHQPNLTLLRNQNENSFRSKILFILNPVLLLNIITNLDKTKITGKIQDFEF